MPVSKADELNNLYELKKKGYINEEEYNQQKAKILENTDKSVTGILEKFKVFMLQSYPDFRITNLTKTSIDFQKIIPEQKPGCGVAVLLFLLGIIPGVLYYFATRKNERILNIHASVEGNNIVISGYNENKITNEFINNVSK